MSNKTFAARLLEAAMTEQPAKGNTFRRQLPPATPEVLVLAKSLIPKKFISKEQRASLETLADRWNRCWQFELNSTEQAAKAKAIEQTSELVARLVKGEAVDLTAVRSRVELLNQCETLLTASKLARQQLYAQANAIEGEIIRSYLTTIKSALAELKAESTKKARVFRLASQPSADELALESTADYLERTLNNKGGNARPMSKLREIFPDELNS